MVGFQSEIILGLYKKGVCFCFSGPVFGRYKLISILVFSTKVDFSFLNLTNNFGWCHALELYYCR